MMEEEAFNSLESWIVVNDGPFKDTKDGVTKMFFLIDWNEECSAFAINCRSDQRCASDNFNDATSEEDRAWCDFFSIHEVISIHRQLCLLHSVLEDYFPYVPEYLLASPPWRYLPFLSYFVEKPEAPPQEFCKQLEAYFKVALDFCGKEMIVSTLFGELNMSDYYENYGDLKMRTLNCQVYTHESELNSIQKEKSSAENVKDLEALMQKEDEMLNLFLLSLSEMYSCQLQPHLDLREAAYNKAHTATAILENSQLGPARRAEISQTIIDANSDYQRASSNIQQIYLSYYNHLLKVYDNLFKNLKINEPRFGRVAFRLIAYSRMIGHQIESSRMRLFVLRVRKQITQQSIDKGKQEIAEFTIDKICQHHQSKKDLGLGKLPPEACQIEKSIYDLQLKSIELRFQMFTEEESILKSKLSLRLHELEQRDAIMEDAMMMCGTNVNGNLLGDSNNGENNDIFFDCEEDDITDPHNDEMVTKLNDKLAVIFKKRANLRNKERKLKMMLKSFEDKYLQSNSTLLSSSSTPADPQKSSTVDQPSNQIDQARRKTLDRLRQYKLKRSVKSEISSKNDVDKERRRLEKLKNLKARMSYKSSSSSPGMSKKSSRSSSVKSSTDSSPRKIVSSSKQPSDSPSNKTKGNESLTLPSKPPPPPPAMVPPPPPPMPSSMVPPPPPPPPMPSSMPLEGFGSSVKREIGSDDKAKEKNEQEKESFSKANKPVSLGELLSARTKLKSTTNGEENNRKAIVGDAQANMLAMIKKGVKLKPMSERKIKDSARTSGSSSVGVITTTTTDFHTELKAAINRIRDNIEPRNRRSSDNDNNDSIILSDDDDSDNFDDSDY